MEDDFQNKTFKKLLFCLYLILSLLNYVTPICRVHFLVISQMSSFQMFHGFAYQNHVITHEKHLLFGYVYLGGNLHFAITFKRIYPMSCVPDTTLGGSYPMSCVTD
jgi:hypothetical protein